MVHWMPPCMVLRQGVPAVALGQAQAAVQCLPAVLTKIKRCSRCLKAKYCGTECSKDHWSEYKDCAAPSSKYMLRRVQDQARLCKRLSADDCESGRGRGKICHWRELYYSSSIKPGLFRETTIRPLLTDTQRQPL